MAPPFAYDADGALLVCGDGPEVIGYHGETEAPLFRFVHDAPVLSLQVGGGAVWLLDASARLLWLSLDGALLGQVQLEPGARALAPVRNGRSLALYDALAVVLTRDGPGGRVLHPRLSAAALDASGSAVLVGDLDGKLARYQLDGTRVTSLALGGPIASVATAPGCFFAATGARVVRGDEQLKWAETFVTVSGEQVEQLATQDSKRLVAARMKGNKVMVLSAAREVLASGSWLDKQVGELSFGPLPWFGVGLDGGDGNKVNLITGMIHRTDTHPERTHHRWMLSFGAKDGNQPLLEREPPQLVPPASAPAAAPIAAPVAPGPVSAPAGLSHPPPAPAARKKGLSGVAIGLIATVVALPLLCFVFALFAALLK